MPSTPFSYLMIVTVSSLVLTAPLTAQSEQVKPPTGRAQVVLLGTGLPLADPDRSGPATAIVVNGTPYLVDFGAGVVRRAKAAVADRGITALETDEFPSGLCDPSALGSHRGLSGSYSDPLGARKACSVGGLRPNRNQGHDDACSRSV